VFVHIIHDWAGWPRERERERERERAKDANNLLYTRCGDRTIVAATFCKGEVVGWEANRGGRDTCCEKQRVSTCSGTCAGRGKEKSSNSNSFHCVGALWIFRTQ